MHGMLCTMSKLFISIISAAGMHCNIHCNLLHNTLGFNDFINPFPGEAVISWFGECLSFKLTVTTWKELCLIQAYKQIEKGL